MKSLRGSTMENNAKICEKYCCKEPRCAAWVLRLQSDATSNCPAGESQKQGEGFSKVSSTNPMSTNIIERLHSVTFFLEIFITIFKRMLVNDARCIIQPMVDYDDTENGY